MRKSLRKSSRREIGFGACFTQAYSLLFVFFLLVLSVNIRVSTISFAKPILTERERMVSMPTVPYRSLKFLFGGFCDDLFEFCFDCLLRFYQGVGVLFLVCVRNMRYLVNMSFCGVVS